MDCIPVGALYFVFFIKKTLKNNHFLKILKTFKKLSFLKVQELKTFKNLCF